MAVNEGKDVFCVVATGMGKTVILQAGALAAHARGENAIALIIVPTKVLVEQQVCNHSSHRLPDMKYCFNRPM
jgi:superfamily II DNA or RNA helicase